MKRIKTLWVKNLTLGIIVLLVIYSSGCGSYRVSRQLSEEFRLHRVDVAELGNVTDETDASSGINVVNMFTDAVKTQLLLRQNKIREEGLVGEPKNYVIDGKILEYEKGNACKRWLLPGWGSTVLYVSCSIKEKGSDIIISEVDIRRSISFGGLYTIGAWASIFNKVAKDVVKEVYEKKKKDE